MRGIDTAESMTSLRAKLVELKGYRKSLQDQVSRYDVDSKYAENELTKLTANLEGREKIYGEKQIKLKKYDEVLEASEGALKRIIDTAAKLDEILDQELASIKTSSPEQQ